MTIRSALLAACLVCLTGAAIAAPAAAPDRVYVNAKVWTGDAAHPAAEAFAVQGDRLVAVGSAADVRALAGPATQVVDLGGHRVVPGFNDAHWHLPARKNARLDDAGSVEVIQQRLVEYATKLPPGSWVMGRGPAFHDQKSASALRQAMRSASGGGSSASQARDQFACSTT